MDTRGYIDLMAIAFLIGLYVWIKHYLELYMAYRERKKKPIEKQIKERLEDLMDLEEKIHRNIQEAEKILEDIEKRTDF